MQYLTIDFPVRWWQLIDGCVDNSTSIDVVDGVIATVATGACVRDAGWRAAAAYDGERDSYGWPPADWTLPITLRRTHWEWVLSQLDRWEPYETGRHPDYGRLRPLIETALSAG